MYSHFYNLIQKIILKKPLSEDIIKVVDRHNVNVVVDIGCGDSAILKDFKKNYLYHGFELSEYFTNKSEIKYKNNVNFQFHNKSIDEIDFSKFNPDKSIIVLIGLFHHIENFQIISFIHKTKNFKIIGIDAVKLEGQKKITKLLMALDRGKFIRKVDEYKKTLPGFDFFIAKNRYLRFPYDHLVSTRNIDKNIVAEVFK